MSNPAIAAEIIPHPTVLHSPESVRRVEKATKRTVLIIDGRPLLVDVMRASDLPPKSADLTTSSV